MKRAIFAAAALAVLAMPAAAAEDVRVSALLAQGFTIVGTVAPPSGGGGLYLQQKEKLFFCFVSETPSSPTLTTRYCKPVR